MIKMRNCGDFVMELTVSGAQTTTAGQPTTQTSAIVPFNGRISAIFARLKTAGTTGTQYVNLYQNGNAMTTTTQGVFNFASGAVIPTYTTSNLTTTVGNPPKVSKGDVISIANTAVQTTVANDLSVYLTIERQRVGTFDDAIQTDTVGADSDVI